MRRAEHGFAPMALAEHSLIGFGLQDSRSKGCATAAVSALCRNLRKTVDHIGLNVKADNEAAIGCYKRLGFEVVAEYEDCFATTSKAAS